MVVYHVYTDYSKIRDLEEELKIIGNGLKSLEANESSVSMCPWDVLMPFLDHLPVPSQSYFMSELSLPC